MGPGVFGRLSRLLVCAACLGGCYEIPPQLPRDYAGSPASPGWPPLAVYDPDPFSIENRWFHRQFGGRSRNWEILPCHGDEPFGLLENPTAVDRAEIVALLRALVVVPRSPPESQDVRSRIGRLIFFSDAFSEAARLQASWPASEERDEAVRLLRQLATTAYPECTVLPELLPAILREGGWHEASPPTQAGLLSSPVDPRSTRLLRRAGALESSALLRLRAFDVHVGRSAALSLPSECWQISRNSTGVSRRVYRFDRAEWLQGREPWRELASSSPIVIRSPNDPFVLLKGSVEAICSSCHCGQ